MIYNNKKLKPYIDRLFDEWVQHGKIIISVDYDSTLYPYHTIDNPNDITRTIELVKNCQQTGCFTVIFTASNQDRHEEIFAYCKTIGIHVDSINKNPITLPYGEQGKIYYNINLCNRSGLNEACMILEQALYKYRGYLQTLKPATDVA